MGANLEGICLHANHWVLIQCTCSRSKLLSHGPFVKSKTCLVSALKSDFSPAVSIVDTSGIALTDTTLLYFAMEEGIRTFNFHFHTTEKDAVAHQQQQPYLQGFGFVSLLFFFNLYFYQCFLSLKNSKSKQLRSNSLWPVLLEPTGKGSAHFSSEAGMNLVTGFYFLVYVETLVEISTPLYYKHEQEKRQA